MGHRSFQFLKGLLLVFTAYAILLLVAGVTTSCLDGLVLLVRPFVGDLSDGALSLAIMLAFMPAAALIFGALALGVKDYLVPLARARSKDEILDVLFHRFFLPKSTPADMTGLGP